MEDYNFNKYSDYSICELLEAIKDTDGDEFPYKLRCLKEILKTKAQEEHGTDILPDYPVFKQVLESYSNDNTIDLSCDHNNIVIKSRITYSPSRQRLLLIPLAVILISLIYFMPFSQELGLFILITFFFSILLSLNILSQNIKFSKVLSIDLLNKRFNTRITDNFANRHANFFSKFDYMDFTCEYKEISKFYVSDINQRFVIDPAYKFLIKMQTKDDQFFSLIIVEDKKFAEDLVGLLNALVK